LSSRPCSKRTPRQTSSTGRVRPGRLAAAGAGQQLRDAWRALHKDKRDIRRERALHETGGYGHGGAYATYMWIEPSRHIATVYLVQQAGVFPGDGGKARPTFQRLAEQTFGK